MAISVPAVTANAVFRLLTPGAAPSGSVTVIMTPEIVTSLVVGPGGMLDTLAVATQHAAAGNFAVLQAQASDGSWQYVRTQRLTATGATLFILDGTRLGNRDVRVVLLGTIRHGAAVSAAVLVPPPG